MSENGVTRSMGVHVRDPGSMDFQVRESNAGVTSPEHELEAPATHITARAPDDTLSWTAEEFDRHCDAFEGALRRGEQPTIEAFLRDCPQPQQASLFAELMEVELELHPPKRAESSYRNYLQSYPQFADVIETIAFKHGFNATDAAMAQEADAITADGITQVAHFQLQEKLGAGGMGEVWRAWDTRLKRTVAVKIPRNRDLTEEELHRFLREGRAAAQLKHANIVSVYEVGRHGKLAYIVSDYIEGQSLQQWLAAPVSGPALSPGEQVSGRALAPGSAIPNPKSQIPNNSDAPAASAAPLTASTSSPRAVPPQRAAELCLRLASALHHAHECGIVHRDLKPGNILISADGQPYVVDFGIAKWEDDTRQLTLAGYAVGTPAYMSPEQAAGHSAQVDRRSDVYALGAILYRMLTGRASFEGDSVAAVLRAVMDETPPAPRSFNRAIPRDLETICIKAMEKDPRRRYATAEAMGNDLARFLAGEPIVGRRPGLLEKSARLARKRPAAATAVLLGLLAIAAAAVASFLASENRALQGLLPVMLETNPPGARIAFVPLHETTQEPEGDRAVYPSMRSPVNVSLKPGDYLIVAALDDGRFHEVFRRVPKNANEPSRQEGWLRRGDGVSLTPIVIPDFSVTQEMAWVDPNVASARLPAERRPAPFYMDVHELTWRECPARVDAPSIIAYGIDIEVQRKAKPDHAATVSFDFACRIAEKLGKRLPTAGEFLCAASQPRISACTEAEKAPAELGPAGTPECDRVGYTVPIAGLYSNVAEWTTTALRRAEQNNAAFESLNLPQIALFRIVKGGSMAVVEGNPTLAPPDRDPERGFGIERYHSHPGLGFRCVRSASPRFLSKP